MTRNTRLYAALAALAALIISGLIGYAARGDGSSNSTASTGSISSVANRATATAHNAQDVTFAQMMTGHHEQAVTMAGLVSDRSDNPQVKALAGAIEAAQGPEITNMTSWLTSWNKSTSTGGMQMGHSSMPGSMSDADMSKLEGLRGSAFDKQFLTMMIAHHNGAIAMAQTELSKGQYSDALGLAASIEVTQQAQVK